MSDLTVIGAIVAGLAALVAAVFGVGRRSAKREGDYDQIKEDLETRRRIDAVQSLDVDRARERLRDRKPNGDL